jgi:hypothetical protein
MCKPDPIKCGPYKSCLDHSVPSQQQNPNLKSSHHTACGNILPDSITTCSLHLLNMFPNLGDRAPLIYSAGVEILWALHFHILDQRVHLYKKTSVIFLYNHNGFLFPSGQKCHLCNNDFPICEHVLPFHLLGSFKISASSRVLRAEIHILLSLFYFLGIQYCQYCIYFWTCAVFWRMY